MGMVDAGLGLPSVQNLMAYMASAVSPDLGKRTHGFIHLYYLLKRTAWLHPELCDGILESWVLRHADEPFGLRLYQLLLSIKPELDEQRRGNVSRALGTIIGHAQADALSTRGWFWKTCEILWPQGVMADVSMVTCMCHWQRLIGDTYSHKNGRAVVKRIRTVAYLVQVMVIQARWPASMALDFMHDVVAQFSREIQAEPEIMDSICKSVVAMVNVEEALPYNWAQWVTKGMARHPPDTLCTALHAKLSALPAVCTRPLIDLGVLGLLGVLLQYPSEDVGIGAIQSLTNYVDTEEGFAYAWSAAGLNALAAGLHHGHASIGRKVKKFITTRLLTVPAFAANKLRTAGLFEHIFPTNV